MKHTNLQLFPDIAFFKPESLLLAQAKVQTLANAIELFTDLHATASQEQRQKITDMCSRFVIMSKLILEDTKC